uniref:Uncharacterized protein n=1 Tax=viral metagenome TaxID=1070528 RepID=A0A6C0KAL7_9ZZZZ
MALNFGTRSNANFPTNLQQIIDAPVEEVTGPRVAKTKAIATMAIPANAAKAAKARTKRIAAEKKAHKKAHATFKRELKATRKTLTTGWKEEAATKRELARCVNYIFKSEEKRKKKEAKEKRAAAKAAKAEEKKQKAAVKAAKAKAAKLTDHEKLMKRARKAYETEMRRRVKFMRQFSEKYMEYREFLRLDQEGNHTINPFTEEPEQDRMVSTVELTLEDGFVC